MYGSIIDDFAEHATGCVPMLRIAVGARRLWQTFSDPAKLLPVPSDPPDMGA